MRVLILGGDGMLGHKLHDVLGRNHDVVSTVRSDTGPNASAMSTFFANGRFIKGLDVQNLRHLSASIDAESPEVILNCVGIVKQREEAKAPATAIAVNSLFPHQLAELCGTAGIRLIHFSTDCVFSGERGNYTETDTADARDLYGRTKLLGEVVSPGALTLRTSIVGRELQHFQSLLEWLLREHGTVPGFTRAIFTGLTTLALADIIDELIVNQPNLHGLYHVASSPISKFDLLTMIQRALDLGVQVVPDANLVCDRSLVGTAFQDATGIEVPPWDVMIKGLVDDVRRYEPS